MQESGPIIRPKREEGEQSSEVVSGDVEVCDSNIDDSNVVNIEEYRGPEYDSIREAMEADPPDHTIRRINRDEFIKWINVNAAKKRAESESDSVVGKIGKTNNENNLE